MLGLKHGTWVGILVIFLLTIMPMASAEIYSINPCDGDIIITEDASNFYMESPCFDITFPKDYNSDIDFHDKYNDDAFDLKLMNIRDENDANPNQKKTDTFASMGLTASATSDSVIYESGDGKVKIGYKIVGNQVKTIFEYYTWASSYLTGRFVVETRVHKGDNANSTFVNLPSVVDSKSQALNVTQKSVGQNDFFEQVLYVGSSFKSLSLDPIYQVDYSPIPSGHLISGNPYTYNDSDFASSVDITAGVSDDSDSTAYYTENRSTEYYFNNVTDGMESGTVSGGYGWAGNWQLSSSDCYLDDGVGREQIGTWFLTCQGSANAYRSLSINGTGEINLSFWAKAYSLETGDSCDFDYYNGTTWFTILNIADGSPYESASLNYFEYDVSSYGVSSDSRLRVQPINAETDDYCHLDEINISWTYPVYNLTNGTGIFGRWDVEYDSDYQYWLRLKKTTSGSSDVRVYAYNDTDVIAQLEYVDDTLSGTGWFNINVTDLVDYETNTLGLNYTQLRFFSDITQNFSEVQLRAETNDTAPPVFNTCEVNETSLINNGVARFRCNVTDNIDVDSVNGTIEGVTYNFTRDGDWFYYDWECTQTNDDVNFNLAEAVDILGLYNSTNPGLSVSCTYYKGYHVIGFDVPSFNITSSSYVTGVNVTFNSSTLNEVYGFVSSFNLKGETISSPQTVWMKFIVDGIVYDERAIATVESNLDEESAGVFPIEFVTPSAGEHYIEFQLKNVGGSGAVNVNDIDMVISSYNVSGSYIDGFIYNDTFSHESMTYTSVYELDMPKSVNSQTFIAVSGAMQSNKSGRVGYRIRKISSGATSSVLEKYVPVSTVQTALNFWFDDDFESSYSNMSFDAITYEPSMNTSVDFRAFVFNMAYDDGSIIPYNYSSNPLTNATGNLNLTGGWHKLATLTHNMILGDSIVAGATSSFASVSGAQTVEHKLNVSGMPCETKKETYLSSNSDVGNTYMFLFCDSSLVAGQDYDIDLWVYVEPGETVSFVDEAIFLFESMELDIESVPVPPIASSIISPYSGEIVLSDINISWNPFSDPNGDFSYYDISLLNSNGSINQTVNGSTTELSQYLNISDIVDGIYGITVEGCDTFDLCSNTSVNFIISKAGNVSLSNITLAYPPFASEGEYVPIDAVVYVNGELYDEASVVIDIDGMNGTMTWNETRGSYLVFWVPSSSSTHEFTVYAQTLLNNFTINGSIEVLEPYQVCVSLWNDINMTYNSSYKNEFAWVYAVHQVGDPTLKRLFDVGEKFSCPPQSPNGTHCMWHAEYINGTACVDLYLPGNYTLYLIGNNIEWTYDIGSGYRIDCDFCNPFVIQKRLLLNLGNYKFNGDVNESLDLYYSITELYYSGAFFGFMTSWVMLIIYGILAFVAFVGILWATGSLKSAMAGLVLLPTIIHLILTFTL